MLPQANGGTYYTANEAAQVTKSLIDDRGAKMQHQLDLLETAPKGISDEVFQALLSECVNSYIADLRQILRS